VPDCHKLKWWVRLDSTEYFLLERYVRVFAIANPSVACLFVHPSQGLKLSAIFLYRRHAVYLGHPLTFVHNFTEIVSGEPLRRGIKRNRRSK